MHDGLSFRLSAEFIKPYKEKVAPFGYRDGGGLSLGELTFLDKYSRKKEDGSKEQWWEVCERVINGMYSLQKDHCQNNRLPWNGRKAQASAQEAYERMFVLKWTPPGRGMWAMGTPLVNVHKNSAALQNCSFISTKDMTWQNPAKVFGFLMEASMLGVGVGFDNKGADHQFKIYAPSSEIDFYSIPDTREGWVESTCRLLNSYLTPGKGTCEFDYSPIRKAGSLIKTFGGTAAGPEPLMRLHRVIRWLFAGRAGSILTATDIADIGNLIGVCVVSGNVRRSAELHQGTDSGILKLKDGSQSLHHAIRNGECDFSKHPLSEIDPTGCLKDETDLVGGWGWMSNNSLLAEIGQDYEEPVTYTKKKGEPGYIWLKIARDYGRLIDPPNYKDWRLMGFNPCTEQGLESWECCTLVDAYMNAHTSLQDFKRTLKFAYLYAKSVTLLPTHWEETNAIMQRNRRIGTSLAGVADFADNQGIQATRTWMDEGYKEIRRYDVVYSEWLGVRESIKVTTIKPGGTVPIVAGSAPGVHWTPGGKYFLRSMRFATDNPLIPVLQAANYRIEPDEDAPLTTMVVYFPVHTIAQRSEKEVSIYEKVHLVVLAQQYWSDNGVSVTISFKPEEAEHVAKILKMYEGQLKAISFLPEGSYEQAPYEGISQETYESYSATLLPVDLSLLYGKESKEAKGEAYCTTDFCELKKG